MADFVKLSIFGTVSFDLRCASLLPFFGSPFYPSLDQPLRLPNTGSPLILTHALTSFTPPRRSLRLPPDMSTFNPLVWVSDIFTSFVHCASIASRGTALKGKRRVSDG